MLSYPIHNAALDLKGKPPDELPHGLLSPPETVRELVAADKAKHSPEVYTEETELRILNDWTVDWHFNGLGHDVFYRPTPEGPVVLAVGYEERLALTRKMSPEARRELKIWMA